MIFTVPSLVSTVTTKSASAHPTKSASLLLSKSLWSTPIKAMDTIFSLNAYLWPL